MTKILIIGGGSIGKRHLKNLQTLGERDLAVVEVNAERAAHIAKEFAVPTHASVASALAAEKFGLAFVCSPTIFHLENALECTRAGLDVFIEKPVSHSLNGVAELAAVVAGKKIVTMVGSNWKFFPLFQKMKELIDGGAIGKILSARCQFGQYLPDWHPWEDYRQGYSANRKLGGGILLDSHEFDYLTWFLGAVEELACLADKVSNLAIDTEDLAEAILRFESGAIGEIHLDYLQRFYQRDFEFFGELGTITWSMYEQKVVCETKEHGRQEFSLPASYELNQMYVDEIRHFLDSVESRSDTLTPLKQGVEVLKLITAAKESAAEKKFIKIQ